MPSRATLRQRNASCLISNIIGTYLVQARTVWVQIRFQVLSKIVSTRMIRKYHHKPMAPQGRATQPSRDTRKTNLAKQPALSSHSR